MSSIKDIVQNGLCTGCGVCISEINSDTRMVWNEDGFLVPEGMPDDAAAAANVCPFNTDNPDNNEDFLADVFLPNAGKSDVRSGKHISTYAGFAKKFRESSSSGGITTYVFNKLLESGVADHLFVVAENEGSYSYQWFDRNNIEDISKISKTRYLPVTMEKLFLEIDAKPGKVAVSGVACFLKALRLKQYYDPEYREKIAFTIGIICGGLKSRHYTDYLAQKAGILGEYSSQEYRIKDINSTAIDYSFGAYNVDHEFKTVKMRTLGDMWGTGLFKSNACDFCDDVAAEMADLSVGDAWISPYRQDGLGNSVMMTRSILAENIINRGIENRELHCDKISVDKFNESQLPSFKHRQQGMHYRIRKFRRKHQILLKKRTRFYQPIPFEYQKVQNERMHIRAASINLWKHHRNATVFETEIEPCKKRLRSKTTFYHRMQRIRRILKLRTL